MLNKVTDICTINMFSHDGYSVKSVCYHSWRWAVHKKWFLGIIITISWFLSNIEAVEYLFDDNYHSCKFLLKTFGLSHLKRWFLACIGRKEGRKCFI